jgi:hypothetical protein
MTRKKPFSGKKKKEQLKEKRDRRRGLFATYTCPLCVSQQNVFTGEFYFLIWRLRWLQIVMSNMNHDHARRFKF